MGNYDKYMDILSHLISILLIVFPGKLPVNEYDTYAERKINSQFSNSAKKRPNPP